MHALGAIRSTAVIGLISDSAVGVVTGGVVLGPSTSNTISPLHE